MSQELDPRLARRFVRIFDKHDGAWRGLGTGFWLTPKKILTAWHVVEEAHGAGRQLGIREDGRRGDPLPASVAWPSQTSGLDGAILHLEADADPLVAHPSVRNSPVGSGLEWRSKGWPLAVPDNYDWADLRGRTGSLQAGQTVLEVYVEGAPAKAELWQGISGAAVFVGGELAGVVKETEKSWDGHRLYVTCLSALVQAPGFCEALELPVGEEAERTQRRERLLAKIEALLRRHDGAAASLLANLPPPEGSPAWGEALNEQDGVGALFRELTHRSELFQVLVALDKAHEGLLGSEADPRDRGSIPAENLAWARTLEELTSLLIPVLYEAGLVQMSVAAGSSLVSLPVYSPTVAEFLLSARDVRPALFQKPTREDDHPAAQGALPRPKTRQINLMGEGTFGNLLQDAVEKLLPEVDKSYLKNLKIPQDKRRDEVIGRLNRFFDREARHPTRPKRYYVLLEPHEDQLDQGLADLVAQHLPSLRIVNRTGQDLVAEGDFCLPLVRLLLRAS
ncbi:MAG TPA: hypothetical protein VF017_14875 [Thermoanaerobaculia bacterium]|nr:hypothetical protein [Thermoanaerobaculia bacterium]